MSTGREIKGPPAKRIRRSPELLIKELDSKMKKLEERIYKKNRDAVHCIGTAILKRANFDFSSFSKEDLADIQEMTPRGEEIISGIIEKANQSQIPL
ncbi:MAG: hypothetical protein Q4D58_05125 [Synergistaceae bacterium]|nr:hypothetical protein [Synergistaceae bacterium]